MTNGGDQHAPAHQQNHVAGGPALDGQAHHRGDQGDGEGSGVAARFGGEQRAGFVPADQLNDHGQEGRGLEHKGQLLLPPGTRTDGEWARIPSTLNTSAAKTPAVMCHRYTLMAFPVAATSQQAVSPGER